MDKYIGFDIDSKKTVACVIQKGKPLTSRRRPLSPSPNFDFFVNRFRYMTYEGVIFAELADIGLSGCRQVVGVDA